MFRDNTAPFAHLAAATTNVEAHRALDSAGEPRLSTDAPSLSDGVVPRLRALCLAVGFSADATERAVEALSDVFVPWGNRPVHPHWTSDITEDHSAVEFSLSIHDGKPEVRMMIEAQGDEPTILSQHAAAMALTERIGKRPGVSLDRFHRIEGLFRPGLAPARYGLWHSICFTEDRDPTYKVYFNPLFEGEGKARAKVELAMDELGLGAACRYLLSHEAVREPALDVPKYFALDLSGGDRARVKVYLFHRRSTTEGLERVSAIGRSYVPGHVTEFVTTMAPAAAAKVLRCRPAATCFAYTDDDPRPSEINTYVPVCAYARDDLQIQYRILRYLEEKGQKSDTYVHAVTALSGRPLHTGLGIHSYMSSSHRAGHLRTTVYLSPELRRVHAPGTSLGSDL